MLDQTPGRCCCLVVSGSKSRAMACRLRVIVTVAEVVEMSILTFRARESQVTTAQSLVFTGDTH